MTISSTKRPIEAIYPLSPMQQGMLFHSLYAPESGVYIEQVSCTLRGELSIPALERAWQRILERHAVLRTAFSWKSTDRLLQIVQRQVTLPLAQEDWRTLPPDAQEARLAELLAAERTRGFDVTRAPLMRLCLLRVADNTHYLVWTFHHILIDGWSFPLVLREVFSAYEAFRAGDEPRLPAGRPYRDYITWLQRQDTAAAEAFWRRTLAGFTAPTRLVVDHAPSGEAGSAELTTTLSAEATAALAALGRQRQVTLNTMLQAAWAILLHRYSGDDDVVFGATVSGRPADLPGVETMVGLFINTLPVRARILPDATLGDLLRDLQALQGELRQFEYTPLVQAQEWSEVQRGMPLFESILVFENYPVAEGLREHSGSLGLDRARFHEQTNYPLTVVSGPGREMTVKISYDRTRFDQATIERMLVHLRTLLEAFPAAADRPLRTLPLLTPGELGQLAAWNDTTAPFPHDRCVHQLFEEQATRTPTAPALRCAGRTLSYAELNARANQLAHYLCARGIGPETLVGICADPSPELIVAVLGVLKAGGAYLPLDPRYPDERLALMLDDARPAVVIVATSDERRATSAGRPAPGDDQRRATSDGLYPHNALRGYGLWATDYVQTVVNLSADWPTIATQPATNPASDVTPEHLAYVIYTSGSTGRPKGVMLQHRGLNNFVVVHARDLDIVPGRRVLQFAAFSFDASVAEIFAALTSGAMLVLAPRETLSSGPELLHLLGEERITNVTLPPSLLAILEPTDLPDLLTVVAAGERCPVEVARRWSAKRRFFNAYGPTEATVGPCWHLVTDAAELTNVPIGKPIQNTQIYILDQWLRPVPVGVPGELYIGGVGLARGYLNRPDLTAERFLDVGSWILDFGRVSSKIQNPKSKMYKTGDLGRYLPDGTIEYLGRIDDQVKLRGFRIELGEIEAVLRQHPDVRDAAVAVREDAPGDQRLVAYVVRKDEGKRQKAEGATEGAESSAFRLPPSAFLRTWLQERLPDYMIPAAIVMVDRLPLTPSGKVDRKALPAPDAAWYAADQYVAPRTPEEELLAGLWAQILNVARAGVHDSFFDLGGHSLLATQLLSRIRDIFQIELPLRVLFETPTLAQMAAQVVEARRAASGTALPPIAQASRESDLPLSFAQQRLWFLDQLDPDSPLYNNFNALRLSGVLDVNALTRALDTLIRRHESLRTTFPTADSAPRQVIAPADTGVAFAFRSIDIRHLSPAARDAETERLAAGEARTPFDLARGPLLRVMLVRLDEEEHLALFTIHHIISDGWSIGVLVRELAALYTAFAASGAAPLADLPIQYADYAAWQRAWLQGETLETQVAYWQRQLAGAPALLTLPTDRPRPAVQSFNGAHRFFHLSPELSSALATLNRQERATMFMTLLAGFQALLHRYSGQDDICVGTPIAGRTRAETEGLIGFFVNTLVLRAQFPEEVTFRALLQRVRETALGAYAHQDLPFETLVERLQPERNLSHTPLFQVMFVLNNTPLSPLRLPGLTIAPLDAESGVSRFDMTLMMRETDGGIVGSLEYNTDLFDDTTIVRFLAHFETLLAAAASAPDTPVARLPLLDQVEHQQILVEWNRAAAPVPDVSGFHKLFERCAATRPEAPAAVFGEETLSYGQLDARANRVAHYLRSLDAGPGTLVGLCLDRSLDLPIATLGTLKAGAAFLPLDPTYPVDRLRFMVEDARPQVVLTQQHLHDRIKTTSARVVLLDAEAAVIARQPNTPPDLADDAERLAYVIYTSGSTGTPKGTLLHHRGLINLAAWQERFFRLGPGARVLQFAALSFDACVWELAMSLASGATLVLAPQPTLASPPELRRLIQHHGITTATLPPSLLVVLDPADLPSLHTVVAAGEACSAELVATWGPGRTFVNAYGPTETTVCATAQVCDPADPRPPAIGRPIANTTVYVLDRHMQPVPVGVPGELYIAGAGVAHGYLNRPELTTERFIDVGLVSSKIQHPTSKMYKTGDLVRWRADGTIEFLGRIDQQVKLRGFRIEPGEIEAALRAIDGVQDALVLARVDRPGDSRLVAYIVPKDEGGRIAQKDTGERMQDQGSTGRTASPFFSRHPESFSSALAARLPHYMVPADYVLLEAWPQTPSGKIDRAALPAPERDRAQARQGYIAPRTSTEAGLAEVCADLLGLGHVGVEDNFFELGGHSLLATQLLARVRAQYGVEVPLRTLFEQPTVAGLAVAVDAGRGDAVAESDTITQLLARVEGLSDEEVATLLEGETG